MDDTRTQVDRTTNADGSTPRRRPGTRRVLVTVGATTAAAVAFGALATGAVASAASDRSHPDVRTLAATAKATRPSTGHPWLRHVVRRAVSGQVTLRSKGGTFQTYEFDRGVVRSVTASTIVVAPADAPTTTVSAAITATTRFRGLPQSQLQPGDRVVLIEQSGNAVVVGARAPEATTSPTG